MAFGFLKKIFSFGKKEIIEVPQEGEPPIEAAAPLPELSAPTIEVVESPAEEFAAAPVAAAIEVSEPEAAIAVPPEPKAPPAPKARPQPKPAKPRPPAQEPARIEPEPEPIVETGGVEAPAAAEEVIAAEPESLGPAPAAVAPVSADAEPDTEAAALEELIADEMEALDIGPAAEALLPEPEPEPEPEIVEASEEASEPDAPVGKVLIGATEENTFVAAPEPEEKLSWFGRLKKGLSRSSKELTSSMTGIFTKRKLDEDTLQELEDVLIQADLGMETALRITDALSSGRYGKQIGDDEVRAIMSAEIEKVLTPVAKPLELDLSHKPHVILVVGVNGTGKTTTIGKLSAKLREAKLNVWLAAGDTFRAAAIEQLHIWGERTGAPVVSTKIGADAAGLAYDAYEKAKIGGADVLIIDTAGRLQNRTELMDELAKIVRVLNKLDPESPHTVLQTLDATTGQNALSQVEIFKNVAGVNGLVMTKLDGTARGGILVAIAARHKLPVYFVGVGETVDDLEPFSAKEFASAIAGIE